MHDESNVHAALLLRELQCLRILSAAVRRPAHQLQLLGFYRRVPEKPRVHAPLLLRELRRSRVSASLEHSRNWRSWEPAASPISRFRHMCSIARDLAISPFPEVARMLQNAQPRAKGRESRLKRAAAFSTRVQCDARPTARTRGAAGSRVDLGQNGWSPHLGLLKVTGGCIGMLGAIHRLEARKKRGKTWKRRVSCSLEAFFWWAC